MKSFRRLVASVAWMALPLAAQSQDALVDLQADGARTHRGSAAAALAANTGSPRGTVEAFLLAQGRGAAVTASLQATGALRSGLGGVRHGRFTQNVDGLDVYGTYAKATFDGNGGLIYLVENLATPPAALARTTLTPAEALQAAAAQAFPGRQFNFRFAGQSGNTTEFDGGAFFHATAKVTRVALPLAGAAMREGYLVETWTQQTNDLLHTVVGNGGRILHTESRTANDSYNIFPEHPAITLGGVNLGGAQTIVNGPGTGNAESKNGWISADGQTAGVQSQYRLAGNNTDTYLDRDNSNGPDAAGATIGTGLFTAGADLLSAPTLATNQQVAIQNLFYSTNVIHDKLYRHGFTEAAGNFQENNFGRGGTGSDSVLAEAQDGGSTNNANFSTPTDGSNPRMQMYLWTRTTPNRDGDVDSDIVFHEYGHGLTWRMIGSMSGCVPGAIGEGASDTLAIWMNGDDAVGEYSYNLATGIRRYRYTNYPRTYSQQSGTSVHANGELFAAIMWKARENFTAAGVSTDVLWNYFVDGMNYIPAGPRFEHMRDGIVQAAASGGQSHQCLIWRAFAKYGVGVGSSGSCNGSKWRITQSFAVPAGCPAP